MPLISGTRLGRYEIRSKLGEGGMGEVYLAQDTKLDRKVALKILPSDLASDRDRMERFVREAKSAAALNHPYIAHVYEIGEHEGVNFIAMEFIDGETLRELIHQKQTDLSKLLRHLQHGAEGLAKAHAAGIVHRDLKPRLRQSSNSTRRPGSFSEQLDTCRPNRRRVKPNRSIIGQIFSLSAASSMKPSLAARRLQVRTR